MDPAEVRRTCRRFLSAGFEHHMRDRLLALAARAEADGDDVDVYGVGGPVAAVERRVAELLGKPAARWVSTGVIAQQAALRVWTQRTGRASVALHPLSHLDRDEGSAYQLLHGLQPLRVGDLTPYTVDDLDELGQVPGVVTVELPLRFAGLLLPAWDDLVAISAWCAGRGVPLHLAALAGLDTRLPALAGFRERAITLAAALGALDGVFVTPQPPHVNGFHLYLPGPPDELARRHLDVAAEHGDWLFGHFWPTSAQGQSVVEVRVGESTAAFSDADVVERVEALLSR